ncbi:MAG: hypothetical protein Q9170_008158, partial [Blastenia crenularia]
MPHARVADRQEMARRIRAEQEADERRQARQAYAVQPAYNPQFDLEDYYEYGPRAPASPQYEQSSQRYMDGPIFKSPLRNEVYPEYSPGYQPQYQPQEQPRKEARPAPKRAERPSERPDLHGPTVREAPANRNPEHPKYRETRASDGRSDNYQFVKKIGEG